MQTTVRTSGLQSAGRAQVPARGQRGCTITRACTSSTETIAPKDQSSLAFVTAFASSVVAIASAAPAFADEAPVATITTPGSEVAIDYTDAVAELFEPIPSILAPSLKEDVDVPLAPEIVPVFGVTADADPMVMIVLDDAEDFQVPVVAEDFQVPVVAKVTEAIELQPFVEAEAVLPAAAEVVVAEPEAPAPAVAEVQSAPEPALEATVPVVSEAAAVDVAPEVAAPVVETEAPVAEAEAPVAEAEAPVVEVPVVQAVAEEAAAETPAVEPETEAAPAPAPVLAEVEPVAIEEAPAALDAPATEPVAPVAAAEPVEPVVPETVAESLSQIVVEEESAVPVEEVAVPVVAAAEPEPAVVPAAPASTAPSAPSSSPFDLQKLLAGFAPASPAGASGASAETATYGALGAAALAFVATFFVAPRFRDSFKEPVDWKDMYAALATKGVKTVTPEEAYAKAKKGAVILDVRLADKFASRAAAGSVNVPLYQPIAGWDAASNVRRAGFAFFGIYGTELNADFMAELAAKVPKNKEVIVMCEAGGSLDNKPGTQFGFQSRSLKALYYLQQAGYTKVLHMKGGLGDWQRAGLPLANASEETPASSSKSGRLGSVGSRNGSAKGSSTATSRVSSNSSRNGTVNGTGKGTSNGSSANGSTGKGTAKASVSRELVSAYTRSRR